MLHTIGSSDSDSDSDSDNQCPSSQLGQVNQRRICSGPVIAPTHIKRNGHSGHRSGFNKAVPYGAQEEHKQGPKGLNHKTIESKTVANTNYTRTEPDYNESVPKTLKSIAVRQYQPQNGNPPNPATNETTHHNHSLDATPLRVAHRRVVCEGTSHSKPVMASPSRTDGPRTPIRYPRPLQFVLPASI